MMKKLVLLLTLAQSPEYADETERERINASLYDNYKRSATCGVSVNSLLGDPDTHVEVIEYKNRKRPTIRMVYRIARDPESLYVVAVDVGGDGSYELKAVTPKGSENLLQQYTDQRLNEIKSAAFGKCRKAKSRAEAFAKRRRRK